MEKDESASQFKLLRARRFAPLFATQLLGAFNDNLFKNTLIVLLVAAGARGALDSNTAINLAAGLFVLPFFLFSPLAGQLADKYDKALMIRRVKLAEIAVMVLGVAALATQSWWGLMAALFLMGAQSAFFGPLKYAILPQLLDERELVAGNAQVEMGTFAAILVGTLLGTLIGGLENYLPVIGGAVVAVAVCGWLASRWIPAAEPRAGTLQITFNPFVEMLDLFKLARQKMTVWHGVLGISWFWLLGSSYLTQTPNFAVVALGGDSRLIALLLCTFTVGIACGTLLCDRFSGHKIEIGLVPLGSLGLSIFGIDLYFASRGFAPGQGAGLLDFFTAGGGRIVADMALLGAFGGLYIVPLNALIQSRTEVETRARVIACNNILNALFMVAASLLGVLLLGVAGIEIREFFLVLALMNIAVALYIYRQVPEFTMRFLAWLLGHSLYRVRHRGLENIPDRGAAILACNHVSYVDALILAGAVRRPVRFIMYQPIYDLKLLKWIFRAMGAIPICSKEENAEVYDQAMDAIAKALGDGELLCIFPEGKLTQDGRIGVFKPGIERILRQTPAAVVPVALGGLWGSFFSHQGGAFRSRLRPGLRVDVVAGEPLPPESVGVDVLREKVSTLRGDRP